MKKRYAFLIALVLLLIVGTGCEKMQKHQNSGSRIETKQNKKIKNFKEKNSSEKQNKKTILNELKGSTKTSLKYYALGDSLSVGLFSNKQDSRFTTLFKNDLEKGTGKKVIEINNSSVGKTVTNFGLPNVQNLIDSNPDIVTIEFGTNDSAYGVDSKNLGDFINNLDTLVGRVKNETQAKILLMTTWSPSDGQYKDNDSIYDQQIKKIGKKYQVQVVDLSKIWKDNPQVTENDLGYSQVYNRSKDTFHPNQQGHDKIAELLYQTIKE